jgi:hypothetical protein
MRRPKAGSLSGGRPIRTSARSRGRDSISRSSRRRWAICASSACSRSTCRAGHCRHQAVPSADHWSDDVAAPTFGPRMVCTRCGIVGADARPNWKEQPQRESLTGVHGDAERESSPMLPFRQRPVLILALFHRVGLWDVLERLGPANLGPIIQVAGVIDRNASPGLFAKKLCNGRTSEGSLVPRSSARMHKVRCAR